MVAGGGGGGEEPEEGDGCHLVGDQDMLSVAKARVVLVTSGRVETVRLTLTCGDPMPPPLFFFLFFWARDGITSRLPKSTSHTVDQ